jgi:hypothetical protein
MIVFDEIPHDLGGAGDDYRVKILVRAELPETGFINQEQAVQHAMLAHQILGRSYLRVLFRILFPGGCPKRGRHHESARERCACNGGYFQKVALFKFDLTGHCRAPI